MADRPTKLGARLGARVDAKEEILDGPRNVVSVPVSHSLARPIDADFGSGPDAEERAVVWRGKPPPRDEVALRRSYDMNKKLADDLSRSATIKIGRGTTR